jgi:hypothetical protein
VREVWRPTRLELDVDLEHGGRWTSLRGAGHEWLWTHPDPSVAARRRTVRPGTPFVDAGGVEECFPTVRGRPDHGDAWSRVWNGSAEDAEVLIDGDVRLWRTIRTDGHGVRVDHEITGAPGTRFVHAVHALVDVGPAARLVVPGATTMLLLGDDGDVTPAPWPSGLDVLGPDDGTATCVIVPRCHAATVVDGDHALDLAWDHAAQPGLCSLMLWRNLGGWPVDGPYRSIGVEPMIGRTADPTSGSDDASARIDASGHARWDLRLAARRRWPTLGP